MRKHSNEYIHYCECYNDATLWVLCQYPKETSPHYKCAHDATP